AGLRRNGRDGTPRPFRPARLDTGRNRRDPRFPLRLLCRRNDRLGAPGLSRLSLSCRLPLEAGAGRRLWQMQDAALFPRHTKVEHLERPLPFPNIDPVAFAIGPVAIRWYALAYLFGVLLGAAYGWLLLANRRLWYRGAPPFPAKDIWDFAFWAMLAIVIGGRAGYVLFYNLPYYLAEPAQIINTRSEERR